MYNELKYRHTALQKKPVVQLKAASAINRIMVLCDATLSLLNMLNLEVWHFYYLSAMHLMNCLLTNFIHSSSEVASI